MQSSKRAAARRRSSVRMPRQSSAQGAAASRHRRGDLRPLAWTCVRGRAVFPRGTCRCVRAAHTRCRSVSGCRRRSLDRLIHRGRGRIRRNASARDQEVLAFASPRGEQHLADLVPCAAHADARHDEGSFDRRKVRRRDDRAPKRTLPDAIGVDVDEACDPEAVLCKRVEASSRDAAGAPEPDWTRALRGEPDRSRDACSEVVRSPRSSSGGRVVTGDSADRSIEAALREPSRSGPPHRSNAARVRGPPGTDRRDSRRGVRAVRGGTSRSDAAAAESINRLSTIDS